MARLIDADIFIRDLTAMKKLYDAIELDGMIKALKEAPTIEPKQEWISVEDRLPEEYMRVLTYSHADGVMIGSMDCDGEFHYPYCLLPDEPTHWMPLPEPPKEG